MEIAQKVQNRKAVAPIIATLLLVAIAVVGGIIVFVWASGMFGSTSGTALPTAESVQLIGYDARDVADLTSLTTLDNSASTPGELVRAPADGNNNGEFIVLKVRNTGSAEVSIKSVTVVGVEHTWHGDPQNPTTPPAEGKFQVYAMLSGDPVAAQKKTSPTIAPGEDARIAIMLGDNLPDDISTGRNLQVKIKTSNGSAFNFFVVTGQAE